ncbi:hypothetical protein B0E55_06084 [Rhodococcus sp. 66b]|nr:hypothetical protein B0E55_06084 [Rhodococcus sp. 66b]
MVVGSGFVITHAAAVFADSRETPLDHPDVGPDMKPGAAGDPFDDLNPKGENLFRPPDQPSWVAAVAQTSVIVENAPRRTASTRCAASRSWMEAAVTITASDRPLTCAFGHGLH